MARRPSGGASGRLTRAARSCLRAAALKYFSTALPWILAASSAAASQSEQSAATRRKERAKISREASAAAPALWQLYQRVAASSALGERRAEWGKPRGLSSALAECERAEGESWRGTGRSPASSPVTEREGTTGASEPGERSPELAARPLSFSFSLSDSPLSLALPLPPVRSRESTGATEGAGVEGWAGGTGGAGSPGASSSSWRSLRMSS
mmetsp:Transcript_2619/g.9301  ORF Transcript_2619/g.9301 Transcript_2619/m.9301 type:complete len:211 (-) Transcript_2619:3211-3843(-)